MLQAWQERLQAWWVQSPRNRILITAGTGVLVILLLCGCCNLVGSAFSGVLNSALASSQARPTIPVVTPQQANNLNPTFPLPAPTFYAPPGQGATPVPASGTPVPSPTIDPNATPTRTPGEGNGGHSITYTLSPDPAGQAFTAGQTNQILLSGPPGKAVNVSVYAVPSCLNLFTTLDANGQGSVSCDIPISLKGSKTNMSIIPAGGKYEQFNDIPII